MVAYDEYYETISVAWYFLKTNAFLGWTIRLLLQPIAEQLTILMIFIIVFTTQTFDNIMFKRKKSLTNYN